MRFTLFLSITLITWPVIVVAQCLSRFDRVDPAAVRPLFIVSSCSSAKNYVEAKVGESRPNGLDTAQPGSYSKLIADMLNGKLDAILNAIQSTDQAVEVRPVNESARAFMNRQELEVWLFRGNCESLPLNASVHLDVQQHCSDTGPTLVSLFGDVTISNAILE